MKCNMSKCVIFVASAAIRVNSFQIGTIVSAGLVFANARPKLSSSDGTNNATRQIIKKRRAARSSWRRVAATIAETVLDDETLDAKRRFMPTAAACGMGFYVGRSAVAKAWSRSGLTLAVLFALAAFLRRKQTSGSSSSLSSDATAESASDVNDEDGDKEESDGDGETTTIGRMDLLEAITKSLPVIPFLQMDRLSLVHALLSAPPLLPKRIHRSVITPIQRVILNPVGQPEKLQDIIVSMIVGSQLIYSLADIRGILKNHDRSVSQYPWVQATSAAHSSGKKEQNKRLVDFKHTNTIITSKGKPPGSDKTTFQDRNLKYPISLGGVLDFISENRRFLTMKGELMLAGVAPKERLDLLLNILRAVQGEFLFDDSPEKTELGIAKVEEVEKVLRILHAKSDSLIVEFDDQFSNEELVYGIMVNR